MIILRFGDHDYHVGVQKYVTNDLGVVNSNDTWHGKCDIFFRVEMYHRRYVLNRNKECGQCCQGSGTRSSQR